MARPRVMQHQAADLSNHSAARGKPEIVRAAVPAAPNTGERVWSAWPALRPPGGDRILVSMADWQEREGLRPTVCNLEFTTSRPAVLLPSQAGRPTVKTDQISSQSLTQTSAAQPHTGMREQSSAGQPPNCWVWETEARLVL